MPVRVGKVLNREISAFTTWGALFSVLVAKGKTEKSGLVSDFTELIVFLGRREMKHKP